MDFLKITSDKDSFKAAAKGNFNDEEITSILDELNNVVDYY